MDQGALQALKQHYWHKLLCYLVNPDDNGIQVKDFLKTINMEVTADLEAEAWEELVVSTLC